MGDTNSAIMTPRLILSLFPGIDLLGMGFERAGYTVVRGPDPLFGGDIRGWHVPDGVFGGIIGGSPCQEFSRLNRTTPTGYGLAMVREFERCVNEAKPTWFLLENVPGVPALSVKGYKVQRMHVRASEFGATSHRLRIFQFGYSDDMPLMLSRPVTNPKATEPAALACEGSGTKAVRRSWAAFCAVQGLAKPLELSSFTKAGKYRAVGNGVHLYVAEALGRAIATRFDNFTHRTATSYRTTYPDLCACECGRRVHGRTYATAACRKRAQRMRDRAGVTGPQAVTAAEPRTE